tara:strand:+ start:273 stop:590 length:318 start_codon:yes stop_codon:yes gene_type:complete
MLIEYKRGKEVYRDYDGRILEIQKIYNVYHVDQSNEAILNNGKIGFISKCDVLKEWFFFKNQHSDYFVGGLTLKETKQNLERLIKKGFYPSLRGENKSINEYFNH